MFREEASSSLPSGEGERVFGRGNEEVSDEDWNPRHRSSWRDIVGDESLEATRVPTKQPRGTGSPRGRIQTTAISKPSPERMFSREEVIELLRESKLKDSGSGDDGWTEVTSKATKKKATSHAHDMLGVPKKKRKVVCWECKSSDHLSRHSPLGMTCYFCHQQDHRIADCPRYRPKARRDNDQVSGMHKDKGESSHRENKRSMRRVFIPLTKEMVKAKQEPSRLTGILVGGYGHPSTEDMIEGLKVMSERLSKFKWRPFGVARISSSSFLTR